ncbi:uncharacterized protein LOC144590845, partial [Rhinoraja longicauda]
VNKIYMNNPNFVDIVVNEFRSGSVVSSTTISVQPNTISLAEVAQTLANNTALFASAGLRFDVNALTNTNSAQSQFSSTTELPTTSGPTTASTTESPTTTTQNRVVANVPLSFSVVGDFEPSLNNRSSRNFRSLAASITTGLDAVYRPDPNYRRAIVNNFR